MSNAQTTASAPWWRFGHVWMVIAGPAIVVVAAFVTLYLAISHPDPVLTDRPAGVEASQKTMDASLAPAQTARNHATTGEVPVKATQVAPNKP